MVELTDIGPLGLAEPAAPGRHAHLAAASGLVRRGSRLFVVADDEFGLAVFDARDPRGGRLLPLSDEELPLDPKERKAAKPDLEALAELPGRTGWPDGALLAVGSGSTDRRERAWLWALSGDDLDGEPVEVSLALLYDALRSEIDDLNIEGAAIAGGRLWLAQRGNGADGANVLVELALEDSLAAIERERALTPAAVSALHAYDLGEVEGVPLTFSDLTPLSGGRLMFCAVAEDSASTYHDGPCVGAAVGVLEPAPARVEELRPLPEPHKIEGVTPAGGEETVFLVADADDPEAAAPLFEGRLRR